MTWIDRPEIRIAIRFDYVDWNTDSFRETGDNIGDDLLAIVPALSWRPVAQTVLRFNYRYTWQHDLLSNPASRSSIIQLGLSSYF